MGKRSNKQRVVVPPTACLSQAVFTRHLSKLGFADGAAYRAWCRQNGFGQGRQKSWKQRREEKHCALKKARQEEIDRVANRHASDLGLRTLSEYAQWCETHGISCTKNKSRAQRRKELEITQRERADTVLQILRPAQCSMEFWLEAIFDGSVENHQLPTPLLQRVDRILQAEKTLRIRKVFRRLLFIVAANGRLLRTDGGLLAGDEHWYNTYVYALYALARQHSRWLRGAEDWKPLGHTARAQFHSLARHLLAEYEVPAFMDRAWFEGCNAVGEQRQEWFIQIGRGRSVRELQLPVALTRMAAYHFLKAPADYSFEGALRWGQTRGAGGSERLARAVAASSLRDIQTDEPFWSEVIHWFVHRSELATSHVGPIVDFIFNVKFMPRTIILPDGEMECLPPPEPEFTMKGRTPAALLRRVEEWHAQLAREQERPLQSWNGLGLEGWIQEQPALEQDVAWQWTIRELVNSNELQAEGRAMNNCVATYINSCVEGKSSIWSLRLETPEWPEARRIMTIEVDPETKTIVQARGKCNVVPSDKSCPKRLKLAPNLLRQWAARSGLRLDPHAW